MVINFDVTVVSYLVLAILREKPFLSIQHKKGCLAASNLFHMFTQSIKFCTFHYHVLESTDV